jgi:hypothetical protein
MSPTHVSKKSNSPAAGPCSHCAQPSGSCSLGNACRTSGMCSGSILEQHVLHNVCVSLGLHWGYSTARAVDACAYESEFCQE